MCHNTIYYSALKNNIRVYKNTELKLLKTLMQYAIVIILITKITKPMETSAG